MAASVTLIIVGVLLLAGGEWPAVYPAGCILVGAAWWHMSEHTRRMRLAGAAPVGQRLAGARKLLAASAAALEALAILVAGASCFDRPDLGLLQGFSAGALLGVGACLMLLAAAAQLNALKGRLRDQAISSWLTRIGAHTGAR